MAGLRFDTSAHVAFPILPSKYLDVYSSLTSTNTDSQLQLQEISASYVHFSIPILVSIRN